MAIDGKGSITDNDIFIFPKDQSLTADDLRGFIHYQINTLCENYKENISMYKGHYPILDKKPKPLNKPDNRIVINFAKYIVDVFNGYLFGIPPQITYDGDDKVNEDLQNFNNTNSITDKLNEVAKQTSIYGRSYLFCYYDEHGQMKSAISSPQNSFIVYDNTIAQTPLYFIRYIVDDNNHLTISVYDGTQQTTYNDSYQIISQTDHMIGSVPAIEFIENEERQGVFESVKTIMNGINNAVSQKANDVEAIADAYLYLSGGSIKKDDLQSMADNRVIINPEADSKAEFLTRPNGDGTQENLLDRLEKRLFTIAMVANLDNIDSGASSTASGYSIELRMQSMRGLASNKERKFTNALREFYKLWFDARDTVDFTLENKVKKIKQFLSGTAKDDPINHLQFKFSRNLPRNIADEANTAKTLEGIVSKETQLGVLSNVPDPKAEIQKIEEETNQKINNAIKNNPADYDFTTPSKISGEEDGK